MKKCPLCGKEYEMGEKCPSCNVMLIDPQTVSGNAAEKKKTGKVKRERVGTDHPGINFSGIRLFPFMIIGLLVLIVIVFFIVSRVWLSGRDARSVNTPSEETWGSYSGYSTDDTQENTDVPDASVSLNEQDFADSRPVTVQEEDYEFSLPAYWEKLCTSETMGNAVYYYQNRSRGSEGGGYLFSIQQMASEYYSSSYTWLGESDGTVYALVTPDEPAYDPNDPYAELEYNRLTEDLSLVKSTFTLTAEPEESEYIFAKSGEEYLTRSDLEGLTAQELSYARNEIYARHGRRFQDAALQSYFDSKDWYSGTIDPEEFTESMLNQYEKANAELILDYEKEKGYID